MLNLIMVMAVTKLTISFYTKLEDRIARRLAKGLPAEYTEEELLEIEKRKEKEAEEAFKKRNVRINCVSMFTAYTIMMIINRII